MVDLVTACIWQLQVIPQHIWERCAQRLWRISLLKIFFPNYCRDYTNYLLLHFLSEHSKIQLVSGIAFPFHHDLDGLSLYTQLQAQCMKFVHRGGGWGGEGRDGIPQPSLHPLQSGTAWVMSD
uniref:Uncharacterized protein n=1 Tax=Pipistrellus kuhlii TaxID=59472 RepID=A0A7J7YMP2_PIPKU|nr:hypothetical protein mPipKuh1_010132 [Pipistrellus kuhlii]